MPPGPPAFATYAGILLFFIGLPDNAFNDFCKLLYPFKKKRSFYIDRKSNPELLLGKHMELAEWLMHWAPELLLRVPCLTKSLL